VKWAIDAVVLSAIFKQQIKAIAPSVDVWDEEEIQTMGQILIQQPNTFEQLHEVGEVLDRASTLQRSMAERQRAAAAKEEKMMLGQVTDKHPGGSIRGSIPFMMGVRGFREYCPKISSKKKP
jgi:hypothetical protein